MRSRSSRTIVPIGRYRDHEMRPAATPNLIAEGPMDRLPGKLGFPSQRGDIAAHGRRSGVTAGPEIASRSVTGAGAPDAPWSVYSRRSAATCCRLNWARMNGRSVPRACQAEPAAAIARMRVRRLWCRGVRFQLSPAGQGAANPGQAAASESW